MLATLGGFLALLVGLLLLLLPLLASELSRARDSFWGAVVLLLGLVLVTSSERLTGAPMLAVLCGGLLIGRLGVEVGQARWRQLTDEERQRLWSLERWQTSLNQLGAALFRLLQLASGVITGLGAWLAERRAARRPAATKRWVRPEATPDAPAEPVPVNAATETPAADGAASAADSGDDPVLVSDFEAIDALLERAPREPEDGMAVEVPEDRKVPEVRDVPEQTLNASAPASPDEGAGRGEAG